jgi:hypothetical protein
MAVVHDVIGSQSDATSPVRCCSKLPTGGRNIGSFTSRNDISFLYVLVSLMELSAGLMKEDGVVRLIRVMLSGWAASFSHPVLGAGWGNELIAVQREKLDGACRLAVGQIMWFWLLQFVNAGPSLVIRCSIRSEKYYSLTLCQSVTRTN